MGGFFFQEGIFTPFFQSDMCSLMMRAAASALCWRPMASMKSPSGSGCVEREYVSGLGVGELRQYSTVI